MLTLLIKTLGVKFYQQHIGLFLVAFYLLFGLIQGQDLIDFHVALLISICASPLNLLLFFLFWILYVIKCVLFVWQKLALDDHLFIRAMTVLPNKKQYGAWVKVYAFLTLPILAYCTLMLLTSLAHHYYLAVFTSIAVPLLLISAAAAYTFYKTNFTFRPAKDWIKIPTVTANQPFWTWPIFYLFNQQFVMFVLCKVISMIFFKVILLIFADVGNEVRVYLTALLAVVLSHAILIFTLVKFDAFYLAFTKVLPIANFKKLTNWLFIWLLLLLPELAIFAWVTNFNILQFCYGFIFATSAMLFLQMLVYSLNADMERYFKYLLFFFFISMLSILAGYYLLFSIVILVVSIGVYLVKFKNIDLKEIA